MKTCKNCGKELKAGKYCKHCYQKLQAVRDLIEAGKRLRERI